MNSKRLLILLIISLSATANAQNATIDSLKTLLERPDADSIKLLIELTKQNNLAGTYEAALVFSSLAVPLALKGGDSLEITMAYRFKGAALRRLERSDEALELINKAFAIAQRNDFITERKFLLNSMAIIYSNKAQYDMALEYYFQTLIIREVEGDQSEISIVLNNIGSVYFKLKNYRRALEYFTRSLKIRKLTGDNYGLETVLINVALSEAHLGDSFEAIAHLNEAFAACADQCSDEMKMEGEFGSGVAYYDLGEFGKSLNHFSDSYILAQKEKNLLFQSESLLYLGMIAMKSGHLLDSEKLLKQAESIANEAGYNQLLIDIYKESSKLYSLKKDEKREVFYLKKYVSLSDSLLSLDLVRNIATIQSRYDERENIKNIKALEENIALKNEAIAKQQLFNVVLGSAAVLLLIIGVLIYRLYVLRNRSNKQLDDKVRERTRQLEEEQARMHSAFVDQHSFIENLYEEIRALVFTLQGLSISDKHNVFSMREFQQIAIGHTTNKLNTLIDRINKKRLAAAL